MKLFLMAIAMVLLVESAGTSSAQTFSATNILTQAQDSAAGMKAVPCGAQTTMMIPAEQGIKLSLTDQEMQKFLQLARYAKEHEDHSISGWLGKHVFVIDGGYAANESFVISNIYLIQSPLILSA